MLMCDPGGLSWLALNRIIDRGAQGPGLCRPVPRAGKILSHITYRYATPWLVRISVSQPEGPMPVSSSADAITPLLDPRCGQVVLAHRRCRPDDPVDLQDQVQEVGFSHRASSRSWVSIRSGPVIARAGELGKSLPGKNAVSRPSRDWEVRYETTVIP